MRILGIFCYTYHLAAGQVTSFPTFPDFGWNQAFLGVEYSRLPREKARLLGFENPYGAYIEKVLPNSAAADSGLEPFDYIYGIDEYRVGANQELGKILQIYQADDEAVIFYIRRKTFRKAPVRFISRAGFQYPEEDPCTDPFLGVQLNLQSPTQTGVRINVIENSTAAEMGLQDGDILIRINDYPMIDWDDIRIAIDNAPVHEPIEVDFVRRDQPGSGIQNLKSYCETVISDQYRIVPTEPEELFFEVEEVHPLFIEEMNQELNLSLSPKNDLAIHDLRIIYTRQGPEMQFSLSNRGDTFIKIYRENGRITYDYQLPDFSGPFTELIDIFLLNQQYFLEITQQGRSRIYRIKVE